MKIIISYLAILLLVGFNPSAAKVDSEPDILKYPVTMTVYAAETLESVMFRIDAFTDQRMGFSSQMLQGHRAKAAEYKGVPLRRVLQEQLEGTRIGFRVHKKRIWLAREVPVH